MRTSLNLKEVFHRNIPWTYSFSSVCVQGWICWSKHAVNVAVLDSEVCLFCELGLWVTVVLYKFYRIFGKLFKLSAFKCCYFRPKPLVKSGDKFGKGLPSEPCHTIGGSGSPLFLLSLPFPILSLFPSPASTQIILGWFLYDFSLIFVCVL